MAVFVFFAQQLNLFLVTVVAALLYFGLLYLLKAFGGEDKRIFEDSAQEIGALVFNKKRVI